jgi:predicted nuclease of restriction endonuclease-like (RecB) superfamily
LPWKHHCLLLDKLAEPRERLWYAAKAVEHGWSRDVLALQIGSGLHTRQGKAVTNFKTTLPPPQSDLAQQITKDPYVIRLVETLPKALQAAVPNVKEIESGLAASQAPPTRPKKP